MNDRFGFVNTKVSYAFAGIIGLSLLSLYFFSDVYRTKMSFVAKEIAQWTPDNIARDPAGYLDFCESEASKALTDMKASEIAIAQNRGRLVGMKDESMNKVRVGDIALGELKELFKTADTSDSWPVSWRGELRDKEWIKRQIVAINKQVDTQRRLVNKIDTGAKNLDAQTLKIQEARARAQEQIAEIKTSREMLRAQNLSQDLTNRLVAMRGVLQATINTASDATGIVSLDQLATENETTLDNSEFDKIMGKQ